MREEVRQMHIDEAEAELGEWLKGRRSFTNYREEGDTTVSVFMADAAQQQALALSIIALKMGRG